MRALPLAVVISCACAAKPEAAAPVANTTKAPAKRAAPDPLGLAEGVVWTFTGTATYDDGTRDVTAPIELTTRVIAVVRDGDRTVFRVSGWPNHDASSNVESQISVEDGVVLVDGDPWFKIEPRIEGVGCLDDSYCWSVEPSEEGGFDLVLRTRPDVTVYHLDPGRGITDFSYHHNGSTNDLELHRD